MAPEVDLVINTYERTYRDVFSSGWFAGVADQNRFPFARRTALVNNVADRPHAEQLARGALERGEIDSCAFVEDLLPRALEAVELTERDLAPIPHYSDGPLVAVTMEGPPWLAYWDAGIGLERPLDWITPSAGRMEADARLLVANPTWVDPTLERETIEWDGDFALGQGFSDQLFLARRSDLAAPIYRQRCLASMRYPLAHVGRVFEARVDAWMRHHDRLRATYTGARYLHPREDAGASYPTLRPAHRLRWYRNQAVLTLLRRSPWKPRCCRRL